jgi:hypothetical protein
MHLKFVKKLAMATSSFAATAINLMPVSEMLVRSNHTLWKAQVLTTLRGV